MTQRDTMTINDTVPMCDTKVYYFNIYILHIYTKYINDIL
jgi:hypothetical protein